MEIVNLQERGFTRKLQDRALYCLYRCRAIKVKHHRHEHQKDIYKIEIGKRYRLISSDMVHFELMSHEKYNRLFL